MAINLSTKSEELICTLDEEQPRALYWLKKNFGGDKKYEKMRDNLLAEAKSQRKSQRSELVEYKSKSGNRWLAFEEAKYYPESGAVHTMPYAFCYYETYGSIGMFMRVFEESDRGTSKVVIFTSHFFQRWCDDQRKMGKMMGRQTIVDFLDMFDGLVIAKYEDDEDGRKCIDVRISNTIGRGIVRRDNPNVFEVRTVLTDKMLSKAQLKKTKGIREHGDVLARYTKPLDVRISEMLGKYESAKINGTEKEFMNDIYSEMAEANGIKTEDLKNLMDWFVGLQTLLSNIAGRSVFTEMYDKLDTVFESIQVIKTAWDDGMEEHFHYENVIKPTVCDLCEKLHLGVKRNKIISELDKMNNNS